MVGQALTVLSNKEHLLSVFFFSCATITILLLKSLGFIYVLKKYFILNILNQIHDTIYIVQDMESIVQTMMQQLLSKEILQEPMKEIGERYPKWLEEHKSGMSKEEYDRYHRQYELILKLNEVYENDSGNFPKIVDLMQKMQECGQPPNDIVQELAPDLDLSNLGQL